MIALTIPGVRLSIVHVDWLAYRWALEAVCEGDAASSNAEGGACGGEGAHSRHVGGRQVAILHLLDSHPHASALPQIALPTSRLATHPSYAYLCLRCLQFPAISFEKIS